MNILLNGQDFAVPDGTTIAGLVALRRQSGHLRSPAYAVERNKDVVIRAQHDSVRLQPGDKIEIVVMVGGG
jgi:thiamine biosynthesis protein ThiS